MDDRTLVQTDKAEFPVGVLLGDSPNAIKTQIYCVLMAQLLMVVVRRKSEARKSFANMITVIRLHLKSYMSLTEFVKDS